MKKIKIAIVGYGNRGQVYADYSLDEPNEVEVAAVIDPNEYKLKAAKERYGMSDDRLFTAYADFVAANVDVDIVINATMEQYHYETAMEILRSKHHMLIEKPIVANKKELMEIYNAAQENECMVFVCHVLRYSPFYKKIKSMIVEGKVGRISSMEMNEHVWVPHYMTSYVRGKWGKESECGSPMLLAKCCHDMDLIAWLNSSKTEKVASFGHRSYFIPENKPEGATEYCHNCPHEADCIYSAIEMYYRNDVMPFLVWDSFNKPYDEITKEEKMEFLKTNIYGKCVFDCGGDIIDRQGLTVDFADGSVATFVLSCGAAKPGRYIHIVGTKGEIEGKLEDNQFVYRTYDRCHITCTEEVIDLSKEVVNNAKYGGHSGGDYGLMYDLVRYLNGDKSSMSITLLKDSLASHLLVYGAEESRKTDKVVNI